jgi:hypothetical protein
MDVLEAFSFHSTSSRWTPIPHLLILETWQQKRPEENVPDEVRVHLFRNADVIRKAS